MAPLFNPSPRVEVRRIGPGLCLVVDDALRDPDALVAEAAANHGAFEDAPYNAYPGLQWSVPEDARRQCEEFFERVARSAFGGRRTVKSHSRMAMTTRPEGALRPMQWLCHRDSINTLPEHVLTASVLYLFRNPAFGGTGFYAPRRPAADIARLMIDSNALDREAFLAKYDWPPGYMRAGNEWFARAGSVEARWNRMIFYDGRGYHSGDIGSPEALRNDPRTGRLTLTGFYTSTRKAAPGATHLAGAQPTA